MRKQSVYQGHIQIRIILILNTNDITIFTHRITLIDLVANTHDEDDASILLLGLDELGINFIIGDLTLSSFKPTPD